MPKHPSRVPTHVVFDPIDVINGVPLGNIHVITNGDPSVLPRPASAWRFRPEAEAMAAQYDVPFVALDFPVRDSFALTGCLDDLSDRGAAVLGGTRASRLAPRRLAIA